MPKRFFVAPFPSVFAAGINKISMTLNEANFVLFYVIYCCHSLSKYGKYFAFPAKCVYILQGLEAKAALLLTDTQGNETI